MQVLCGIDIGGTKCTVSFGSYQNGKIQLMQTLLRPTIQEFPACMDMFISIIQQELADHPQWILTAIGIACGGPLDPFSGKILSPPNLPLWDNVNVIEPLKLIFDVPVNLRNDADACALAEWKLGSGRGTKNMIFLTFGTGMGAGLILNGQLYTGSCGLAGEVGHIGLESTGPMGYGKEGSFEGFCSGGGIANLGKIRAREALDAKIQPLFCPDESALNSIDAKKIAQALAENDPTARKIYDTVATYLGKGLAILIDILNPELIVLGSIFLRQREVLEKGMWEEIMRQALPQSIRVCRIEPSALGEDLGNYAALSVALDNRTK